MRQKTKKQTKIKEDIKMNKITSFTVDHTKLEKGLYISRIDGDITTYDLRMRKPNTGDLMSNSAMHSFEHMLATFLRNSSIKDNVIYCGPMGCQTGFYVLIKDADNENFLTVLKECLKGIISYEGEMFGNSEVECGNHKNLSTIAAKEEAAMYLKILENHKNFSYE